MNSEYGYRSVGLIDSLCEDAGLKLEARISMPANNFMLVYRRL